MIKGKRYNNISINYRICLSEGMNYELFYTNKTYLICKGKMFFVNEKFKVPKKSNDKDWKITVISPSVFI